MKHATSQLFLLFLLSTGCRPESAESALADAFDLQFYSGSIATIAEARDIKSLATYDSIGDWTVGAEKKSGSLAWNVSGRRLMRSTDVRTLDYAAGTLNGSGYRNHTWIQSVAYAGPFSVTGQLDLFGDSTPPSKKLKFNIRFSYDMKPKYKPSGPPDIIGVFPRGRVQIVCKYLNEKGKPRGFIYADASKEMNITSDQWVSDSVSLVTAGLDLTGCKALGDNAKLFLDLHVSSAQAVRFDSAEIQMLTEN